MLAGYPYDRPPTSFIFVNGPNSTGPAAYTFDNAAWVPPSSWHGSLDSFWGLQVTDTQGQTARYIQKMVPIIHIPRDACVPARVQLWQWSLCGSLRVVHSSSSSSSSSMKYDTG
jgi:hypothetical protein